MWRYSPGRSMFTNEACTGVYLAAPEALPRHVYVAYRIGYRIRPESTLSYRIGGNFACVT